MTNLQLISDALRLINVISEIDTPSAEQGSHGLRRLNQMLEAWTEDDVQLGYFAQTSTGDPCPIPAWAERAVTSMLAIDLAPTYGATISAELGAIAGDAYGSLVRKCISEKNHQADMDHMPAGSGNFGIRYNINNDIL